MRMKREINVYSITEYTKIEKHLEEMARQGWILKKTGSFIWKYEEVEPKNLHYSIVFFPKTNALEPEAPEKLVMFREFCEKTGWKLAAEMGQMQIFYNEALCPVPIETEAWMQLKNIHETAKVGVLLPYGMLIANALVQMLLQLSQYFLNPLSWLSGGFNIYLLALWMFLGIGSSVECINYIVWHKKAKKIAEEENYLIKGKSMNAFRCVYLGASCVVLLFAILSLVGVTSVKYGIFVLLYATVVIGVPVGLSRFLKAKKIAAKVNLAVTIVASIITAIAMVVVVFGLVINDGDEFFHEKTQMPLQISDLKTGDFEESAQNYWRSESLILSHTEALEFVDVGMNEDETISIEYEIMQTDVRWVYNLCKEELLHKYDDMLVGAKFGFKSVEMPVWQAEEVYQYYTNNAKNEFILCYENKLIRIEFNWDVTEEEMKKAYDILREMK